MSRLDSRGRVQANSPVPMPLCGWMDAATQPAGRPDPEPLNPKQVRKVMYDHMLLCGSMDTAAATLDTCRQA
jgi:hypothetical protein